MMDFHAFLDDPHSKADDPGVRDMVAFSNAFQENREHITTCATLTGQTIFLLEQVGCITASLQYAIANSHPSFLSAEDASFDVSKFENNNPTCENSRLVLVFHEANLNAKTWDRSVGIWKHLGPELTETFFSTWLPRLIEISGGSLKKLQDRVLKLPQAEKFKEKPAEGWPDSDHDKLLAQMQDFHMKLAAFQDSSAPKIQQLELLQTWIKELQASADIGLTEDERSMKAEITNSMASLLKTFPPWGLEELMGKTIEELQSEVVPRKAIAENASKFLTLVKECSGPKAAIKLEAFGTEFAAQVQKTDGHVKIVLACQSAFQILNSNDPAKAASFEERRLGPRGLSLSNLPKSIETAVLGLSKRWAACLMRIVEPYRASIVPARIAHGSMHGTWKKSVP